MENSENKLNINNIERYKEAYKTNRIDECVDILVDIGRSDSNHFRKSFIQSNALISPLSQKFDENEFNKNMTIFRNLIIRAKDDDFDIEYAQIIIEMYFYIKLFYENNKTNTERLKKNIFFKYSLPEQLCMICIFLQDQSRIMYEVISENMRSKKSVTGMEANTTFFEDTYTSNKQSSAADEYEAKVELYNVLIQYLFYLKKEELDGEMSSNIKTFPYELPCFEELSVISYHRMMYLNLEEKFRFSNWKITKESSKDKKGVYLFEAKDRESNVAHQIAIHRRYYQYTIKVMACSAILGDSSKYLHNLSKRMDVKSLKFDDISKNEYDLVKKYFEPIRNAVEEECKPYYLKCKIGDLSIEDLLNAHEFLYIISLAYIKASLEEFNENNYASYRYLAPYVKIESLVCLFAKLYGLCNEKAQNIIHEFVYDKNALKNGGDIFMQPLVKVDNENIILCQTLIENMNLNRNIEKSFQKRKIDLSQVGKEYEKHMINELKDSKYIKVNTNKVEFLAYDGKNVEFDFLAVMNEYLLLIEFKSILTPYGDKELNDRRRTITEGVKQVLRRVEIIQKDWMKVKKMVDINLPDEPYPNDRIIKIVCTDIYDFTTLNMEGVIITDDSVLLKYFTAPTINEVKVSKKSMTYTAVKKLWTNNIPNPEEFLRYLEKPDAVSCFFEALHEKTMPIIGFEGDNQIIFKDIYLVKDPFENYYKREESGYALIKDRKIYPNEKCPCGSGKKYKKCCGKK